MRLSSLDRMEFRDNARELVHTMRKMTVLVPTLSPVTSTSFDTDMQSGRDALSGDGSGRVASWVVYEMYCFIQHIEQRLFTFGHVPPGVEIGDLTITAQLQDRPVLSEAYGNEYHYLYIDGETYRIVHDHIGGLGSVEEATCVARKFGTILFRCDGY